MKKKIAITIAAMMAAASIAGCGNVKVDVNELANALLEGTTYSEPLNEVSDTVTLKRYGLEEDNVKEVVAYAGTSAVADELAIFRVNDVNEAQDRVREHWDAQTKSYESYRPEEVPKLDDALLYSYDDIVIFCVSEDSDAARQIIFDYTTK